MTRNGKIARLPRYLRENLNRRLDDGEPGPKVLAWLNECPDVRVVLEREFGGRMINEQNLSEWRQGGFREWQRQQQACDHVRRLTDQSEALDEAAEESNVSDRLATVFAVELFRVLEQLLEQSGDDKEKLGFLREGLREIRLMRRGDHNAARLQMERERWERQCEHEAGVNHERMEEKSKQHLIGLVFSKLQEENYAGIFGGGEAGRKMAAMITKIKFGLPLDDLPKPGQTETPADTAPPAGVNRQAQESNGTQPNQSKSN